MSKAADLIEDARDGDTIVRLSGYLSVSCLNDLPTRLEKIDGPVSAIDLSDVEHVDTIGAWTVHRTAKRLGSRITGANDDAQRLIAAVGDVDEPVTIRPKHGR